MEALCFGGKLISYPSRRRRSDTHRHRHTGTEGASNHEVPHELRERSGSTPPGLGSDPVGRDVSFGLSEGRTNRPSSMSHKMQTSATCAHDEPSRQLGKRPWHERRLYPTGGAPHGGAEHAGDAGDAGVRSHESWASRKARV